MINNRKELGSINSKRHVTSLVILVQMDFTALCENLCELRKVHVNLQINKKFRPLNFILNFSRTFTEKIQNLKITVFIRNCSFVVLIKLSDIL